MTTLQPGAPPPVSPEALERLKAENEALVAQITNQALRQEAGAAPGRRGGVSVLKNDKGYVVVTGADGRTVTYDPNVGMDEDAVRDMVQSALAPPQIPLDPNRERGPNPERIVAIVFTFLLLISLVIAAARVLGKRAMARAAPGVSPDVAARLARIEQAMEAVAIEVERISESERYSARLLTERLPERAPAAAGPNGQPLPAPTLDAVR